MKITLYMDVPINAPGSWNFMASDQLPSYKPSDGFARVRVDVELPPSVMQVWEATERVDAKAEVTDEVLPVPDWPS